MMRETRSRIARQPPEKAGRVLLAAFSRPPEAQGEDVNSSILIAAESVAAYPGLKEAAQYFGPVSEIAKAQGFDVVKRAVRIRGGREDGGAGGFSEKCWDASNAAVDAGDAGAWVCVSFTFIGGTEDEVEELISGTEFWSWRESASAIESVIKSYRKSCFPNRMKLKLPEGSCSEPICSTATAPSPIPCRCTTARGRRRLRNGIANLRKSFSMRGAVCRWPRLSRR